ncbi:MAG: DNA polymerase III subunit gamma/tau [Planctomycetota bacterium]
MSDTTPTIDSDHGPSSENDRSQAGRYQVIARRYRPRRFAEVVGQEAVSEAIRQAILQGRLAHAYLFCGPRGVGKTSMARIFASALQCPDAVDANSCGECSSCQRIFVGEDSDVTELDGASHRGIDDIRSLIEHVQYAPTHGRYRIFIIDEVHMLTREAFNSLLKTLEEPPAHVKFIFATTEPERVIPTVLSRCQRCDFSSISPTDIVRRLGQICEEEGATAGEGLLENIASLARGGMRDAQSLLDQVLSFAGDHPGTEDLDRITGRVSQECLEGLLDAVDSDDLSRVIEVLNPIFGQGTEPSVLTEQIAEELRQRLHRGVSQGWSEKDLEANLLAQEIIQETRQKLRRQDRGDLLLELALMRLGTLRALVPLGSLVSRKTLPQATEPQATEPQATEPPVETAGESSASVVSESKTPVASVGRAQAAREAIEKAHSSSSAAAPLTEPESAKTASAETNGDPFEDLVDALRKESPILGRRLRAEGRLDRQEGGWQLLASERLKGEMEQSTVVRLTEKWQRDHGSLTISVGEIKATEATGSKSVESNLESKPEIVQQAEEIYSSKARNRGPISE